MSDGVDAWLAVGSRAAGGSVDVPTACDGGKMDRHDVVVRG